ncbi:imidazole glycerol phosphate synthase subunit HisF [Sediminibacterium roseum]|uniref:imidazole glycerol-phosphate synthase n=1 Tax=Sediminibacterium roseum TaxID=1978412 RepID=A0ABW9ZRD3_9BACT|nr:imidazole glycerol phosphate synthase cyclase subunit [Sediminibacterium roseum]NCI49080.1 imidazole glycerol phosphate synthase subunit HisF [Sediminibacterium roseum]
MLKKRIVASLVVKEGVVVQSIGFDKYLPVGKPAIAVEFLTTWGIDEIVLLDISASRMRRGPDYEMIRNAAKKCFVPLTVGGGITEVGHIQDLMHCGSDKVSLNQSAIYQPGLITEAAEIFGNQCVVVSIDAVQTDKGYRVYDYISKTPLEISPADMAKKTEDLGAGEIFINSVDRDGSYRGYDMELIKSVCEKVSVPVIACGGAKNAGDMIKILKDTNISAACAGNFFHFTEHSVNTSKANIIKQVDVRLETFADYTDTDFDQDLRIRKKSDKVLEEMLYIRIEKEVI